MLVYSSRLTGTPVLSVQASSQIATITSPIIDPDSFKIIAFYIDGPATNNGTNVLDISSIREYSNLGIVIDDADELVTADDVIKIQDAINLHFNPIGLKVESKKGSRLGKVIDFTVTSEDFVIQQIIVKRPTIKSFIDSELTIHRREIVEITDTKIVVKDEEKVIRERAAKEDFVPNFVNPFRTHEPGFAPADTETPAGKDN